jgi:hypothetical protein
MLLQTRHERVKGNKRGQNELRNLPRTVGVWSHDARPVLYLKAIAGRFRAARVDGRWSGLRNTFTAKVYRDRF